MATLNLSDVRKYVEENIGTFHQKRIQSLDDLKLVKVLKRKNPYLFKAKCTLTAQDIVKGLVDAHISSNEETLFGEWLEGLAVFVNGNVFGGWKSGIPGIDLEFDSDGHRYIVNIKSGPNWGNHSQLQKMRQDFVSAQRTLKTSGSGLSIIAVNGCCYGIDNSPDKGTYLKLCGQRFWEFISGSSDLYIDIIEPLGCRAKEKHEDFLNGYAQMVNKFTREFAVNFCDEHGAIDWEKLVRFNSAAKPK